MGSVFKKNTNYEKCVSLTIVHISNCIKKWKGISIFGGSLSTVCSHRHNVRKHKFGILEMKTDYAVAAWFGQIMDGGEPLLKVSQMPSWEHLSLDCRKGLQNFMEESMKSSYKFCMNFWSFLVLFSAKGRKRISI